MRSHLLRPKAHEQEAQSQNQTELPSPPSWTDNVRLIKIYGGTVEGQHRYSPAPYLRADKVPTTGNPDPKHVSTSYVERSNLTVPMGVRRFTRLTNAFSKKAENYAHAVSLFFTFYNFCRIHKTLRVTPATEAGLTDHVWSLDGIVSLIK